MKTPPNKTLRKSRDKAQMNRRAVGRYLRMPQDKVRLQARLIVGLLASKAIEALSLSPNKSAALLLKVLKSAVANAVANAELDADKLLVDKVYVDKGPMLKRYHPCAHGRAKPILRRSCHITVMVK